MKTAKAFGNIHKYFSLIRIRVGLKQIINIINASTYQVLIESEWDWNDFDNFDAICY